MAIMETSSKRETGSVGLVVTGTGWSEKVSWIS